MNTKTALILAAGAFALVGCATDDRLNSAREWQRAECNRIIDNESRVRCMRRADDEYGRRREEAESNARKR